MNKDTEEKAGNSKDEKLQRERERKCSSTGNDKVISSWSIPKKFLSYCEDRFIFPIFVPYIQKWKLNIREV